MRHLFLRPSSVPLHVPDPAALRAPPSTEIEQAIDVPPPPTISVHPDQPLSDACAALVRTHARRLPLVDRDDQTGQETIISVLTQYRVLKFIAINVRARACLLSGSCVSSEQVLMCWNGCPGQCAHDCARLDMSIGSMGIGSYASWYQPPVSESAAGAQAPEAGPSGSGAGGAAPAEGAGGIDAPQAGPSEGTGEHSRDDTPTRGPSSASPGAAEEGSSGPLHGEDAEAAAAMGVSDRFFPLSTATMQTSVFDVVHIFSERGISAVPIVDEDGVVLNLYETVDIVVRLSAALCLLSHPGASG